ncbi:pyridoxal phosphate-dependent aminotransferase [Paenibacillus sp. 7124]|uniref:Pyridoxal phosphate-dependent aminotransferase n=1 Tax=Paenibacillus apii TaxID=1850370 RepID=A0A6M1PU47_9BACL|nr:pyridoxal phosphate-dependent aminotransferase [Paenibacillus apii]NGM85223.1 pyridoxal phosphate-dependent aminotransferase [Paenibacillus apii]NJJ42093.1 pyridoxal phosphate-dependent aminotransferase [Paenibacillus apii]
MLNQHVQLADWVERVQPSPTALLESTVARYQREGRTVYRLGLGQPDFPTPDRAKASAIQAIQDNFTGYTDTSGILPLREAICRALKRDMGLSYDPGDIVVTVGGKHALFNAICTLCRPGDEVLIPVPYWVSFPEQVKFAGAKPVFVQTSASSGYKVTPETLAPLVNESTRLLILNQPNNPSGAVYSAEELSRLAEFCRQRDLWVISDEVYSAFVFKPEGYTSIASFPGMRERTVVINAVSKSYGMTGWRIGYSAAPAAVTEAMLRLQSHTTSNPSSIAQQAALAAIDGPQDDLADIREEYAARRGILVEGVRRIKGLECSVPDGAFYVWVDASAWRGQTLKGRTISTADDLADILLTKAGVAVMPGTGFGSPYHIRLSYAVSRQEMDNGIAAMESILGSK